MNVFFRIAKSRVRQGELCFEVEWIKPGTVNNLNGFTMSITVKYMNGLLS